jgi:hypothetical protein
MIPSDRDAVAHFSFLVSAVVCVAALRVNDMSIQSSGGLPPPLLKKLWSSLLAYLTEQLVDAYSKAKKCTTEGRGLMTLDLSALRSGLEKLTNLKSVNTHAHA